MTRLQRLRLRFTCVLKGHPLVIVAVRFHRYYQDVHGNALVTAVEVECQRCRQRLDILANYGPQPRMYQGLEVRVTDVAAKVRK